MSSKSERSASFRSGENASSLPASAQLDGPTGQTTSERTAKSQLFPATGARPPGLVPSHVADALTPTVRAVPEKAIVIVGAVEETDRVAETKNRQIPKAQTSLQVAERPTELRYVQVGRTVLPYLESGEPDDNPPLIMAPGISTPATSLLSIAEKMDGHVLIFEAPIIGVPNSPNLPWYAGVTAEAAKQVTGKTKVNAAGHSWGGMLVQELAHNGNIEVVRMGILASLPARPHTSPLDLLLAIPSAENLTASQTIMNPDRSKVDPGAVYGGDISDNPGLIEKYEHLIYREIDERSHDKQLNAFTYGLIPLATKNWIQRVVKGQGPPALVVIGTRDKVIPYKYANRQAEKLGMAVYSVNDGHLLPLTRDHEVAGALHEFYSTPVHRLSRNWRSG
jgi:pimeloyl-ACP methyl ester carboxylesterase